MIELKVNQIIETDNGNRYLVKHIEPKHGGIIGEGSNGNQTFIYFQDFKIVVDVVQK